MTISSSCFDSFLLFPSLLEEEVALFSFFFFSRRVLAVGRRRAGLDPDGAGAVVEDDVGFVLDRSLS